MQDTPGAGRVAAQWQPKGLSIAERGNLKAGHATQRGETQRLARRFSGFLTVLKPDGNGVAGGS